MTAQSAPQPARRAAARKAKTEERVDAQVDALREKARDMREQQQSGYFDRDGNQLVRKNPTFRNEFDFKPNEIPEGWVYQWIRLVVKGDPDHSELYDMQENGWRPVPWERHKGRFQQHFLDGRGCIMRKGQLLVERPEGLNNEAMGETVREAEDAVNTQFRQHNVNLPDNIRAMGLEAQKGHVHRRSADIDRVRMSTLPKHELAID